MFQSLDYQKVSSHFNPPPLPVLPEVMRFWGNTSDFNYGGDALVSLRSCWAPGVGGKVALERLPALVVVVIQTIRGLEPPLGDGHT